MPARSSAPFTHLLSRAFDAELKSAGLTFLQNSWITSSFRMPTAKLRRVSNREIGLGRHAGGGHWKAPEVAHTLAALAQLQVDFFELLLAKAVGDLRSPRGL